MILNAEQVAERYRKTAPYYDAALVAYRILGIRRLRATLCAELNLATGDTVVDMGCGTGANLPHLVRAVGEDGRVVALDLSDAMLKKARALVAANGWTNVELLQADMRAFRLPAETKAVVSAFAMEMVPEYDGVIDRLSHALPAGGRLGLLGLREPAHWPEWLIRFAICLNRPFGVTRQYAKLHPWEAAQRHMNVLTLQHAVLGAVYRCVAEKA